MALTLGTNAYIELDAFKTWCDTRNYSYYDINDSVISGAIVVVSVDFIDPRYTFTGEKIDSAQPMDLPTTTVSISDIENATAQAVWQQLNGQLLIDLNTISAAGSVKMERKKLDTLETEVEYNEYSQRTNTISTARIDALFKPFVYSGGGLSQRRTL